MLLVIEVNQADKYTAALMSSPSVRKPKKPINSYIMQYNTIACYLLFFFISQVRNSQ